VFQFWFFKKWDSNFGSIPILKKIENPISFPHPISDWIFLTELGTGNSNLPN
jgi:hypothetical protein